MFIKRTSTAIHCISTDFLNGIVDVMFNNGSVYRYSNVSRRAIANLQLQRNMSLGFWVNNNLLGTSVLSLFKSTQQSLRLLDN